MRTIIVVSLLLLIVLLAGCPPQQEWKDLMSGTVRMRSMPTADDITVTFTDGGEFSCRVLQLGDNQVAIQPGLIYVVQFKLHYGPNYGVHYRFVQRTAEDQKPGVK